MRQRYTLEVWKSSILDNLGLSGSRVFQKNRATGNFLQESPGFPLGLENLENLEKWEGIFQSGKSQGILNRLEKSGKITQNTGKLRELEINII